MNEQRAVARRSDPWTSWEAAGSVRVTESQREVLRVLREGGPMTDEQLVQTVEGMSPSGVRTRRSELRDAGLVRDTGRVVVGATGRRMVVWEATDGVARCSCGRGPVGHTTTHETTETPGLVRIVRDGKTDQYMKVAEVEAKAETARIAQAQEDERRRLASTPRVDPGSHKLTFGGPVPCRSCRGTGGTLSEKCLRCDGTGLT